MRHRMFSLGSMLVAVFTLWAASPSSAAVITFSDSSDFEAALASFNTWDFNGAEGNPVILLNSLGTNIASVSTQGGDAAGIIHDSALCGSSGNAVDCFKPVVFTLLEPRNAFGFDNLDFTAFEEAVVDVTFVGGGAPFQAVFDLGGAAPFTPIFFGLISDDAIASVSIYSRDPGTTEIGQRANVIDNVRIGNTAVPEPVTLSLIGVGLGGLLLRRRRR